MSARHTQGPWRVSGSHPWRVEALIPGFEDLGETATICEVGYKPNARLIAAAPDLLKAAGEAADQLDDLILFLRKLDETGVELPKDCIRYAEAASDVCSLAIAKAQGGAA